MKQTDLTLSIKVNGATRLTEQDLRICGWFLAAPQCVHVVLFSSFVLTERSVEMFLNIHSE